MSREITYKDLSKAQKRASKKAIELNRALGLSYKMVKGAYLVEVFPDGSEEVIGKPVFGLVEIDKKKFKLADE